MGVESAVQPPSYDAASTPAERSRGRRMLPPIVVAGTLAAATVALHFRDPHDQGSWGQCPSAALGIYCPGCGGLRAVNDLSNGRIWDAASSNFLFFASLPVIAYIFWRWSAGRWTGRPWQPSRRATNIGVAVLVVSLIVFAIVRNLPIGAWLAP